ncbi:MAG: aminotransferase class I/II-fold pyridoxal phosphate-dependent enzyme [Clostridiaceae bacterium]|nr:aminotransferase class I/II-fold pyridoxal phosphate-dependent enzyme [Clostridiaceae bacterium]
MSLFTKCAEFTAAQQIRDAGLYPYFHHLESRQDTEVIMEGKRRIMLGSNNYLGLTVHPEVIAAAVAATEKYGTGCSGSRFLNGTLDLHIQLEDALASFMGAEAALTFSTGFQSNLSIISAVTDRHDTILCDRENHASIYDGCRLSFAALRRYKHSDMEDLERELIRLPLDAGKLIVTDGVFSMSGEIARLPEIVALAKKYNAAVMVDDAHGFGVIGKGGRGTASYFGLENDVDITMSTFSKSLASLGGFMVAKRYIVDYVQHTSRPFIFSASIPPSCAAAALAALRIIEREPERVQHLAALSAYMRKGLAARGIVTKDNGGANTPIVPFYTYDLTTTLVIAKKLYEAGVYVNPVLPPAAPEGECLLRTSLMATHTEAILDEAMDIIRDILHEQ